MNRNKAPPSLLAELLSLLPRRQFLSDAEVAAFYKSLDWARLRYIALRRYGRRCMACGRCRGIIVVDHIKPVRTRPHLRLKLSNLQVLCGLCNRGKGSRDRTDWRSSEQKRAAKRSD